MLCVAKSLFSTEDEPDRTIAMAAEWFSGQSATVRHRAPIDRVGTVSVNPNGSADASGWGMKTELVPVGQEVSLEVTAEAVGGWTVPQLHSIAHGVPCDCPIGRAAAAAHDQG